MNALDHLERVLSATEQFRHLMNREDNDWWAEASAFAADERELQTTSGLDERGFDSDGNQREYWS